MAITLEYLDGATETAIDNLNSLLVAFSHEHILAGALVGMSILLFEMSNEFHNECPTGLHAIVQIE